MTKFRVGDRVKIITYGKGLHNNAYPVGSIGIVIRLDGNLIMVVIDGNIEGFEWACLQNELELVE